MLPLIQEPLYSVLLDHSHLLMLLYKQVDETGQHGLVCAKTDQSTGAKWFPNPRGYSLARASNHYLLAGKKNTEIIIAAAFVLNFSLQLSQT